MMLVALMLMWGCQQKARESEPPDETDVSSLKKEIDLRLREFEKQLQNGDSIALGDMYTIDAIIMPSTTGRENIVSNFGSIIRDSITGSSFNTTGLWGNDQLLVEEGTGIWTHQNGQVAGRGKYIVVWKKEKGNWMIFRDIWFPEKRN